MVAFTSREYLCVYIAEEAGTNRLFTRFRVVFLRSYPSKSVYYKKNRDSRPIANDRPLLLVHFALVRTRNSLQCTTIAERVYFFSVLPTGSSEKRYYSAVHVRVVLSRYAITTNLLFIPNGEYITAAAFARVYVTISVRHMYRLGMRSRMRRVPRRQFYNNDVYPLKF